MDGKLADEDEILLSPNKNMNGKKRQSEEFDYVQDENGLPRESKRAKMVPLPSLTIVNCTGNHSSPQREPRPLADLASIPTPWRFNSPAKDVGPMNVDVTPNVYVGSNSPSTLRFISTPSTPRPASVIQCQTPKGLNLGTAAEVGGSNRTGISGSMSPLTPLPPTPASFEGGPLRAFTLGKGIGQGVLNVSLLTRFFFKSCFHYWTICLCCFPPS